VAYLQVAFLGMDRLRSKGNPVDPAPDIFQNIAVGALADDVADTDSGKAVRWRSHLDGTQQISVAVDVDDLVPVVAPLETNAKMSQIVSQFAEKKIEGHAVEIKRPVLPQMILTKYGQGHRLSLVHVHLSTPKS